MSMAAVENGKATPSWAAYARLVVKNRAANIDAGNPVSSAPNVSFDQFIKIIENGTIVNQNYATALPDQERLKGERQSRLDSNLDIEKLTLSFVEGAYALGMVQKNGILLTNFAAKPN